MTLLDAVVEGVALGIGVTLGFIGFAFGLNAATVAAASVRHARCDHPERVKFGPGKPFCARCGAALPEIEEEA